MLDVFFANPTLMAELAERQRKPERTDENENPIERLVNRDNSGNNTTGYRKQSYWLNLNRSHTKSACSVSDGKIVSFAVELDQSGLLRQPGGHLLHPVNLRN